MMELQALDSDGVGKNRESHIQIRHDLLDLLDLNGVLSVASGYCALSVVVIADSSPEIPITGQNLNRVEPLIAVP